MLKGIFHNVSEAEKNTAVETIIQHATPRQDFFVMLVLSVSMASFGVLLNNTVILIGSMLIAPLLYPLLSLSLGIILTDDKLIGSSVYTLLKSIGYALLAGFVISFFFSSHDGTAIFPLNGTNASSPLMYALVAAIAGFAAAFAITKEHLNDSLPGVAISVALVPPLASAGVALPLLNWTVFSNSFLLFLTNVICIIFSAMIVFSLMRFSVKKTVAKETLKEEEQIIKEEASSTPSA